VGKTATRETYRKEREPRTRRRKIEEARANEVTIPSKQQMDNLTATIRDVCLQEEEIPFHLMPLFRVGESAHTELLNSVERLVEYAPTV
jgi:hypothetical protein